MAIGLKPSAPQNGNHSSKVSLISVSCFGGVIERTIKHTYTLPIFFYGLYGFLEALKGLLISTQSMSQHTLGRNFESFYDFFIQQG